MGSLVQSNNLIDQPLDILHLIIKRLSHTDASRLCQTCKRLHKHQSLVTCIIQTLIKPFYCYENALLNLALSSKERILEKLLGLRGLDLKHINPNTANSTYIVESNLLKFINSRTPNETQFKLKINYILIHSRIFGKPGTLYSNIANVYNDGLPCQGITDTEFKRQIIRVIRIFEASPHLTRAKKVTTVMNSKVDNIQFIRLVVLNTTLLDNCLIWVFSLDNMYLDFFVRILETKTVDPLDIATLIVELCTKTNSPKMYILNSNWYDGPLFKGIQEYSRMMLLDILKSPNIIPKTIYKAVKRNFIVLTPELFDATIRDLAKLCPPKLICLICMKLEYIPKHEFLRFASRQDIVCINKLVTIPSIRNKLTELVTEHLTDIIQMKFYNLYPIIDFKMLENKLDATTIYNMIQYHQKIIFRLTSSQRSLVRPKLSDSHRRGIITDCLSNRLQLIPEICDENVILEILNSNGTVKAGFESLYVKKCLQCLLGLIKNLDLVGLVFRFVFNIHPFMTVVPNIDMIKQIECELVVKD